MNHAKRPTILIIAALLMVLLPISWVQASSRSDDDRTSIQRDPRGRPPAQVTLCDPATEPHIVSRASTLSGVLGNQDSAGQAVSADGRFIAFRSAATNLVLPDTNNEADIFVRDRATCTTTRVSVATGGTQANDSSGHPSLSADGRYVVFHSKASNLVTNDPNDFEDVFLHDRQTGQTTLISHTTVAPITSGDNVSWQPVISADGQWIAYATRAHNLGVNPIKGNFEVVLYSVASDTLTRVANYGGLFLFQAEGGSPSISGDGRYVAFAAIAVNTNIDTTRQTDIYLYDRVANATTRISVGPYNSQPNGLATDPAISADGRYIVYASTADNIAGGDTTGCGPYPSCSDIFMVDRVTGVTQILSFTLPATYARMNGHWRNPSISADGRFVVFDGAYQNVQAGCSYWSTSPYPTNEGYVTPTMTDTPQSTFTPTHTSTATSTPTVTPTGTHTRIPTICVDCAIGPDSTTPTPSSDNARRPANGLEVARAAKPRYHDVGCADVFLYDRFTNQLRLVSRAGSTFGNERSLDPVISGDGRLIVFDTRAANLVGGDTNTRRDVLAVGNAEAATNPLSAPTNLTALALSSVQINLNWQDNAGNETAYRIERSPNGTDWAEIGVGAADVHTYASMSLTCSSAYYYRVRAYRAGDNAYSDYSNVATTTTRPCLNEALAVFNPANHTANLLWSLGNPPNSGDYQQFSTGFPYGAGGQYLMGDWNGDGLDTVGIYRNGAFFFTNQSGPATAWDGVWFGLGGQPVAGRFDANANHDCLGVTDSGTWQNGDTYFALYFTCNLTSGPTPPLTFQWLSILLPNSAGFTGTHQFVAGDFDGNGVDSVAVRRGNFIAWTDVPPTTMYSAFQFAQYIGAPGSGDEGRVVVGDWNLNNVDSFGLVYQNGQFYRRDDLDWNTGAYTLQQFTPLVGTPFNAIGWRPN